MAISNIHPGEILKVEFLKPMKISVYRIAKEIGVPATRIDQIVKGKRSVTPDTAILLDAFFGLSEGFFSNLQSEFELREARAKHIRTIDKLRKNPFLFQPA
jgi:addiction module HigA family antidote